MSYSLVANVIVAEERQLLLPFARKPEQCVKTKVARKVIPRKYWRLVIISLLFWGFGGFPPDIKMIILSPRPKIAVEMGFYNNFRGALKMTRKPLKIKQNIASFYLKKVLV